MPAPLRSATPLDGFPAGGWGDRYGSCIDHKGPASYVQVANATPPTGGDPVTAAECGLKAITMLFCGLSDNGQFLAQATPGVAGGGEPTSWVIRYVTAATGAEVAGAVNLSGRTFRMFAFGR